MVPDTVPVAPHVGAWIEMGIIDTAFSTVVDVAPHVGAWIEISSIAHTLTWKSVAPHVGAWIEMQGYCRARAV